MSVALGFPLNVAAIILGCIFSTLLSVFNALGPISNPTPPTAALTEFYHLPPQEKGKKKKKKKNEMNPPPADRLPKLPKISVVNKSQNEEEAFELRSQLEVIYQYWSVCL